MRRQVLLVSLVLAGGVLAGLLAVVAMASTLQDRRVSYPPAGREYAGTDLHGEMAPDFQLADANGEVRTLSDFRGKAVVLAFLDPLCTDSCPLTALHFRLTSERLGERARQVAFVAVNANPQAPVNAATVKWGMQELPNWHFLTGPRELLQPVWAGYHAAAEAGAKRDKPEEQLHTAGVFVIDQSGRSRWYLSVPTDDTPEGTVWVGPALSDLLTARLTDLLSGG